MTVRDLKAKIQNFKYDDFDLNSLISKKNAKGLRVAVALPVYNEEKTLGPLIDDIRSKCGGLVDVIYVFDSQSTDGSQGICDERGIPFITDEQVAKDLNLSPDSWKSGKGMNLWASTHSLKEYDIITWMDADLELKPQFIYGIVGPLIENDKILLSKGRYKRDETDNRVTRILAEPLMSAFFPETRDFVDPLCGMYGGRTEFLRQLPFTTGYSVEAVTLIHTLKSTDPANIAQVFIDELENREHDNRYLGRMAGSIHLGILRAAEEYGILSLSDQVSSQIVQQTSDDGIEFRFVSEDIEDLKLPPMEEVERNLDSTRANANSTDRSSYAVAANHSPNKY